MKKLISFLVVCFYFISGPGFATKELVFFGDSLSDNGNLYKKLKVIPKSPPYYEGRFSNGPVWAEQVAEYFNSHYRITSQNYAIGGATVVKRSIFKGAPPYDLKLEVNTYLKSVSDNENKDTTYVLLMGANDYLDEKWKSEDKLVKEVIKETVKQINRLIAIGGKDFIIIDVPDIGKAPYSLEKSTTYQTRMHNLSLKHHNATIEMIKTLKKDHPNLRFIFQDMYTMYNQALSDIDYFNEKYNVKISNLTEPCWKGGYRFTEISDPLEEELQLTVSNSMSLQEAYDVGVNQSFGETPCTNQDEYMFWDKIHPTYATHKIIAGVFIDNLESVLVD